MFPIAPRVSFRNPHGPQPATRIRGGRLEKPLCYRDTVDRRHRRTACSFATQPLSGPAAQFSRYGHGHGMALATGRESLGAWVRPPAPVANESEAPRRRGRVEQEVRVGEVVVSPDEVQKCGVSRP